MAVCTILTDEFSKLLDPLAIWYHVIYSSKDQFLSAEYLVTSCPPYILDGVEEGICGLLFSDYSVINLIETVFEVPFQ